MKVPAKEKGAILPIIILILLAVGLFALTKLVNLQQIFKSKATEEQIVFTAGKITTSPTVEVQLTSPYGEPIPAIKANKATFDIKNIFNPQEVLAQEKVQPIFSDDFHDKSGGWPEDGDRGGSRSYVNGNYKLSIFIKNVSASASRNIGMNQFTVVEAVSISGLGNDKVLGITFGAGSTAAGRCSDTSINTTGNGDCYRLYISSAGYSELKYQKSPQKGDETSEKKSSGITLADNTTYTLRIDRRLNSLKSWLSSDNGNSWQVLPEFSLDSSKALTPSVGMVYASDPYVDGQSEAMFSSFKVYKLGDLPEPSNNYTVSGHLKDPSGNPVSGVSVSVYDDSNKTTQSLTTGADGVYKIDNQVKKGDVYAIRVTDGKAKAVGGDHSWISCNNVNQDTNSSWTSYECQLAGVNDCAGPGFNGQSDRCDFTYSESVARTTGYRIAESPEGLQKADFQTYSQHPMKISYTFSDFSSGTKVLFVQFKDNKDNISDPKSASLELRVPTDCKWRQVQCFKAPCDPILVCSTPTPSSSPSGSCKVDNDCAPLVGGSICTQNKCVSGQCQSVQQADGSACKQLFPPFAPGLCQSGSCVALPPSPSSTPTSTPTPSPTFVFGPNLVPDGLQNIQVKPGQKIQRIETGNYTLLGNVTDGGVIQVDVYEPVNGQNIYKTTYPNNSTFTIASNQFGYLIDRAVYQNTQFTNVTLKKDGVNITDPSLKNTTVNVGQQAWRIFGTGTFQLSGNITSLTVAKVADLCAKIQVDEYDNSNNYIKTYPNNTTFTIPSGNFGYLVLRSIYCDAQFSNVSLRKQQ